MREQRRNGLPSGWPPERCRLISRNTHVDHCRLSVALGLLIAVHEYGHYRVAVACGVKVLRFRWGFGKPLLRWQPKGFFHGICAGRVSAGRFCTHA